MSEERRKIDSLNEEKGFDGVIEKKGEGRTALHDAAFFLSNRFNPPPHPSRSRFCLQGGKAKAADYWQQASNCDRGILVSQ